MRTPTLLLVLLAVLIGAFAMVNWPAFAEPTTLSLVVTTFTAPLGLLMLGLVGAMVVAFAVYIAVWQARLLLEARRQAKELQAQRTLADQAEASRFTELRSYLETRLGALDQRLAQAESTLRKEVQDSGNSLAAYLGEIDERRGGPAASAGSAVVARSR